MTGDAFAPAARRARWARIWRAAMLGWACATPVHAADYGLGIGLYVAHDSNISHTEVDPKSEVTQALIGRLYYQESTVDVTARLTAQLERRHYVYHVLPDDTYGYVDGAGVWTLSPRRLTWTVEDTYRMLQVNLAGPTIPTNLTKSNSLFTGPDYTMTFSTTNSVVIGARYGRIDILDSNGDNQRFTAYVRGVHAVSAQSTLSLNDEAAAVVYQPGATVFSKYFRNDLYGRFEYLSALNSTRLDLGATWVTQYGTSVVQCVTTVLPGPSCIAPSPGSLEPGRFARLTFSQMLSPESTARIAVSEQLSDTYTDLISGVTASTAPRDVAVASPTGNPYQSPDLYKARRGELAYGYRDWRFRYDLQGYGRRIDFVNLTIQNYQEKGVTFFWTWLYSDTVRFNASVLYNDRTYDVGRQDRDNAVEASETYNLNRNVVITFNAARYWRRSTAPLNSYVDNRVLVNLAYVFNLNDVRFRQ